MAEFDERITLDTAPAIRLEHDVRYRAARGLIVGSETWCDLGCGNGVAAAAVLDAPHPGRAILVDVAEDAVQQAESRIGAAELQAFRADLTAESDIARVREALLADPPASGCITCFELIEHLTTFVPLVELLVEAATTAPYTVVLSVPNDAFLSIQNPYHETSWSEAAFEELRRLFPDGTVLALQLEVRGSTLVRTDLEPDAERTAAFGVPDSVVASHFVAAFGPRADLLEERAQVRVADREADRMWDRQRDSDLAFFRARAEELEAQLGATGGRRRSGATPSAS